MSMCATEHRLQLDSNSSQIIMPLLSQANRLEIRLDNK
jgi:hypothetical protein